MLLLRKSKISYLCMKTTVHQNVLSLQIPVNDLGVGSVEETQTLCNIAENRQNDLAIKRQDFVV